MRSPPPRSLRATPFSAECDRVLRWQSAQPRAREWPVRFAISGFARVVCAALMLGNGLVLGAEKTPVAPADFRAAMGSHEAEALEALEQLARLDERAEQVLAEVKSPERKRSIEELRQEFEAIAHKRMKLQDRHTQASKKQDHAIVNAIKSRSVLFSGAGAGCGVMELLYPQFLGSVDPKVAAGYPPQIWYAADSSEKGLEQLQSGETEAAVVDRPLRDDEKAALAKAFPDPRRQPEHIEFAHVAVALVVPRSRRVRGMTIQQVEQVFRGTIEKWSAFGGIEQDIARLGTKGPLISWRMFTHQVLNDKPVRLLDFQHDPNDLPSADMLDAFYEEQRSRFPGGGPFPCYETDGALIQAVAKKPNGIGYCLLFPSSEKMKDVRLVPIAEKDGDQAVEPIRDGRLAKEYPLQKTITIILHPDAPPSTRAFVAYATGPKAIKAIEQCGLWPACDLPTEAMKKKKDKG